MITFDAFLVFLAAAALPAVYMWLASRWIEPEHRKVNADVARSHPRVHAANLVEKAA